MEVDLLREVESCENRIVHNMAKSHYYCWINTGRHLDARKIARKIHNPLRGNLSSRTLSIFPSDPRKSGQRNAHAAVREWQNA